MWRLVRVAEGRDPNPSPGILDSQTIKATALVAVVSVASAVHGTIALKVLGRPTAEHRRRLKKIWADGKYNNRHHKDWLVETEAGYVLEIVSRPGATRTRNCRGTGWWSGRTPGWAGTAGSMSVN